MAVNYKCVLKTLFEQKKKELKVGWTKLLDMERHELHRLLDTLVKNMKCNSDDRDETRRTHRRDDKGIKVGYLLHDNARPHIAAGTRALLEEFKCEKFQHSLYSPDLTPSDYHLFLHLKKFLAGQRLRHKTRLTGLIETLGGDLFRRRQTKAGPTI